LPKLSAVIGEFVMNRSCEILAFSLASAAPWFVAAAAAAPVSQSMGLQNIMAPSVGTVPHHRGWRDGDRAAIVAADLSAQALGRAN
jgi:hypothetical protein